MTDTEGVAGAGGVDIAGGVLGVGVGATIQLAVWIAERVIGPVPPVIEILNAF
jgi:hypothetical protein